MLDFNLKEAVGQKVIVTKGMNEPGWEKAQLWCAGAVPVGSIGTIHYGHPLYPGFHIVWDDPALEAKEGYTYAITKHSDFISLLASGDFSK